MLKMAENFGQFRRVSGTNGGEYAGPCPSCGGTDRFRIWPEKGKWWCRGCGKSGDAIAFMREFHGMTYGEACDALGVEPKYSAEYSRNNRRYRRRREQRTVTPERQWEPKAIEPRNPTWQEKAESFVSWCQEHMTDEHISFLLGRGITEETARRFRLGWNPTDLWRPRESWGLPPETNEKGRPKRLWLPTGLTIPSGEPVQRIRVRKPEGEPRYYFLPGSSTAPMVITSKTNQAVVIVESELDGILLHQEAGELVDVVALGGSTFRPDQETVSFLQGKRLLISLDSDEAGAKESWGWWLEHFPKAKRWPVIDGKDPTEAKQNGLDLLAWIEAGLEGETKIIPFPRHEPESNGQEEVSHKCSDCSHFTGSWCSGISWDGKAYQRPEELHSCRNFQTGQYQAKAYDPEVWDTFQGMVESLTRYPHLWPAIRAYCQRELPEKLFQALESEYAGQSEPRYTQEWLSPYPARCVDCSRQEGCKRTERVQWGLLHRHDCERFREVRPC